MTKVVRGSERGGWSVWQLRCHLDRREKSFFSPTFILNKKDKYSRRLHRFAYAITASWLALVMACSLGRGGKEPSPPASFSSTRSEGFTNFETEPVSPLALSADGRYLYALNTADDRLEIFAAQGESLRAFGETTVGLRPVALALRENTAWVVNHLSDSVSVVGDPKRLKSRPAPRDGQTLSSGSWW